MGGTTSRAFPALLAALALTYAVTIVAVAWTGSDKGFQTLLGRRVAFVEADRELDLSRIGPGDRVVAIDGRRVRSTLDYATDILARPAGQDVVVRFARAAGGEVDVTIVLRPAAVPWAALLGTLLAALNLVLGLVALRGGARGAGRFFATTLVFAVAYTGSIHWNTLVLHPLLFTVALVGLFVAPPIAVDFISEFPTSLGRAGVRLRAGVWLTSLALMTWGAFALSRAVAAERAGGDGDVHLRGLLAVVALELAVLAIALPLGLALQTRALRGQGGEARAQLKWMIFGFSWCLVPIAIGAVLATLDFDRFLTRDQRPVLLGLEVAWFGAASLAVLRVRLADVDTVLHRSASYVITTGAVLALALALAIGLGLVVERVLPGASWAPLVVGAAGAAILFGPIRSRVAAEIDRRFRRDRLHYVAALGEIGDAMLSVREPEALAREVAERVAEAMRATGASLRIEPREGKTGGVAGRDEEGNSVEPKAARRSALQDTDGDEAIVHTVGRVPPPSEGTFEIPIESEGARVALLSVGPRSDGDLFSREDRDLLRALAAELAVALENAHAFHTIASMSRDLESQNAQIRGLRDRLEDENRFLRTMIEREIEEGTIVGRSAVVRDLRKTLARLGASDASVLLLGETGTGKGLCARALHAASARKDGPFLHVDLGAVPRGVFESEIFGHERGAFTGAGRARRGACELAVGGTLFLDEIGELPLDLQPKLLRFLEAREIVRVGGTRSIPVDVRVIAATHRDLRAMVERGTFREDLFFRLSVVTVEVPPLRERRGDLAELVESVLPRVARRNHRPPRPLSPEALERLAEHSFPGNVRELENVIERALVLGGGASIEPEDLGLPDLGESLASVPPPPGVDPTTTDHVTFMSGLEKERLRAVMEAVGGNKSRAAKALGIARTTLIHRLRRVGLE